MRTTLMFALLLLGLAVASRRGPAGGAAAGAEPTTVRAWSAGADLPALVEGGRELYDTIVVGDAVFTHGPRVDGLRVVRDPLGDAPPRWASLDLAHSVDGAAALVGLARGGAEGDLVVLAACGATTPVGDGADRRRTELAAALHRMGAETTPFDGAGASWAWIGVYAGGRWRRLAESTSNARGVALALPVPAAAREGAAVEPIVVVERVHRLPLLAAADAAPPSGDGRVYPAAPIGGVAKRAVVVQDAGRRFRRSVVWETLALAGEPAFAVAVALVDRSEEAAQTALCEVLVNGEVQDRVAFGAGAEPVETWRTLSVDLARFANTTVELELRTTFGSPDRGASVAWGEPTLEATYDRDVDADAALTAALAGGLPPAPPPPEPQPQPQPQPPAQAAPPQPAAQPAVEPAPPPRPHTLAFLGHAFPINGYDKRAYGTYMGWTGDPADPRVPNGPSLRERLYNDLSPPRRDAFWNGVRASAPDRLVWGGDSVYSATPESAAHFLALAQSLGMPQVYVPGNHDLPLARAVRGRAPFLTLPDDEETLDGVRLVYLDDLTFEGRVMNPGRGDSRPTEGWLAALHERLARPPAPGETALVLFLHHAPWCLEEGVANVAHGESPWWRDVHLELAAIAQAGRAVWVLSGDGGDRCMADGREIGGVRYIVTGEPRFDSSVPNGWVELRWEPGAPPRHTVYVWTPIGGLVAHPQPAWPWQY